MQCSYIHGPCLRGDENGEDTMLKVLIQRNYEYRLCNCTTQVLSFQ